MTTSICIALKIFARNSFASSTTASSTTKSLVFSLALRLFLRSASVFLTAADTALAVSTFSLTAFFTLSPLSFTESTVSFHFSFTLLLNAFCFSSSSSAFSPSLRNTASADSVVFSPKETTLSLNVSSTGEPPLSSAFREIVSAFGVTSILASFLPKPKKPFLGSTRIV